MSELLKIVSESRLSMARACERKEFYRYGQGYVSIRETDKALRIGTLGHHALEAWWKSPLEDRLANAIEAIAIHATPESDEFELATLVAIISGYHERWAGEPLTPIAVEHEFLQDFNEHFKYGGKIDVLVRDEDGDIYLIDHKFSSESIAPGSIFWQRLALGGQTSGYMRAVQKLGYEVKGMVYDVCRKPALKPYQAGSKRLKNETANEFAVRLVDEIRSDNKSYYARTLITRSAKQLSEYDYETEILAQRIHTNHLVSVFRLPIRNTDACSAYQKMCDYSSVCAGEANLDDPEKFKKLDWKHPELKEVKIGA